MKVLNRILEFNKENELIKELEKKDSQQKANFLFLFFVLNDVRARAFPFMNVS